VPEHILSQRQRNTERVRGVEGQERVRKHRKQEKRGRRQHQAKVKPPKRMINCLILKGKVETKFSQKLPFIHNHVDSKCICFVGHKIYIFANMRTGVVTL